MKVTYLDPYIGKSFLNYKHGVLSNSKYFYFTEKLNDILTHTYLFILYIHTPSHMQFDKALCHLFLFDDKVRRCSLVIKITLPNWDITAFANVIAVLFWCDFVRPYYSQYFLVIKILFVKICILVYIFIY